MSLTHFDAKGDAQMVDVSDKAETARTATARGAVVMAPETLALIQAGQAAKGGPGRASDGSDRCTDASASGRCCDAAGSTCNCAY